MQTSYLDSDFQNMAKKDPDKQTDQKKKKKGKQNNG